MRTVEETAAGDVEIKTDGGGNAISHWLHWSTACGPGRRWWRSIVWSPSLVAVTLLNKVIVGGVFLQLCLCF